MRQTSENFLRTTKLLHQPVAFVKEMNPVALLRVEALMISCDMRRKQKFLQYLVNVTRRWVTVGWAPESFIWFTLRSHHLLLLQLLPAFCIFDICICVCVSEYCPCFCLSGGSSSARRSMQCLATVACLVLCIIIMEFPSDGNCSLSLSLSHSSAGVLLLWSVALLHVVPQSISPLAQY